MQQKQIILVASDSHGNLNGLRQVIRLGQQNAVVGFVFLGDGRRDLDEALRREDPLFPVYAVSGNCDLGAYPAPREEFRTIAGVPVFFTHGDRYGVKVDNARLELAAGAQGAAAALFGHTHSRELANAENPNLPTLFNPGALAAGSYGTITVENGVCAFSWGQLEE